VPSVFPDVTNVEKNLLAWASRNVLTMQAIITDSCLVVQRGKIGLRTTL
jgi:hypothetical protein